MAWVTANLLVLHKMNPVTHSCPLHRLPTVLRFAPSRSDVVCLFTGIHRGERPPKSRVCDRYTVYSSMERTSAEVCLKKTPECDIQQMMNIMSWCTVSIAIPNVVTVKTQILLCSNRISVPTSRWKTQLASMWSTSCNNQHLVHQRSQHKIQWSMLRKWTLRHYRQANTANRQSGQPDDVIKRIQGRVARKRNGSEHFERCAACDQ